MSVTKIRIIKKFSCSFFLAMPTDDVMATQPQLGIVIVVVPTSSPSFVVNYTEKNVNLGVTIAAILNLHFIKMT